MKKIKCFVIMPSGNHNEYEKKERESNFIFNHIISPAVKKAIDSEEETVDIVRETDNLEPGAINDSIVKSIYESEYVIVDITGQNPNVFFELGLRYALKPKTTILIRQHGSYIPFDITNYRCIDYDPIFEGVERSIDKIYYSVLKAKKSNRSDSLVYNVYPNLKLLDSELELDPNKMSWEQYWGQVKLVMDTIKKNELTFDIIFGISKGGLLLADSIHRNYFENTPTLSLWAKRLQPKKNYFNNEWNDNLLSSLSKGKKPFSVIICDDITNRTYTLQYAKEYLEKMLPENSNILLAPLFYIKDYNFHDKIVDASIWNPKYHNGEFNTNAFIENKNVTFPYDKKVREGK